MVNGEGLTTPVLIGSRALHHLAVTLDQRQGLVRFARSRSGAIPAPPTLRGFGMSAPHAHDGVRRVSHVLPGSPADQEHVQAGDELILADGGPAVSLTEVELADLARPSAR